jgi:Zn-finger nucleic acid-binding protein
VTTARCPRCRRDLAVGASAGTATYACGECGGRAVTVAALKQFAPAERVGAAWRTVWRGVAEDGADCPFCARRMRTVTLDVNGPLVLDACRGCSAIWFDGGELVRFSPQRQEAPPKKNADLPVEARRALGIAMAQEQARAAREERRAESLRSRKHDGLGWMADALTALIDW